MVPDINESAAWAEAWETYELVMAAANYSPRSIATRRSAVRCLARRMTAEGVEPGGVTSALMKHYVLTEARRRRHSGIATLYSDLRQFWRIYAQENGCADPMTGVPRPRAAEAAPVAVLSPPQIAAVLKACEGRSWQAVRNRAVVLVLLESGMRRTELLSLEPGDIDLRARLAEIKRGKGGKARTACFGDETALALRRWLNARGTGPGALFRGRRENDLSSSGLSQLLYRIGEKAGVPGLRPHIFRHTWCHYNLAAGQQEHDIMQLAGWSTSKQLGRYGAVLARQRALEAGRRIQVARLAK